MKIILSLISLCNTAHKCVYRSSGIYYCEKSEYCEKRIIMGTKDGQVIVNISIVCFRRLKPQSHGLLQGQTDLQSEDATNLCFKLALLLNFLYNIRKDFVLK